LRFLRVTATATASGLRLADIVVCLEIEEKGGDGACWDALAGGESDDLEGLAWGEESVVDGEDAGFVDGGVLG